VARKTTTKVKVLELNEKPNPFGKRAKLKMLIKGFAEKQRAKAGVTKEGAAWTKKAGQNKEGGLNEKGRKSYERDNPGSDLKAPSKKKGNKRRASFCARMKGMRKRQKPSNNTGDDRLSKSLRAWNCEYEPDGTPIVETTELKNELIAKAQKRHSDAKKKKYGAFMGDAKKAKERITKSEKGVRFYDKKGSGFMKGGKKKYD